jgi:hypothetical protein
MTDTSTSTWRRTHIMYVLASSLMISACATTANYENILGTWVSQPVDKLVMAWGPPQSSYTLSDGGRVIEYLRQGTAYMPMSTPQYGTVWGSGGTVGTYSGAGTTYVPVQRWCKTRFVVNPQGYIMNWQWEGNRCVARAPTQ